MRHDAAHALEVAQLLRDRAHEHGQNCELTRSTDRTAFSMRSCPCNTFFVYMYSRLRARVYACAAWAVVHGSMTNPTCISSNTPQNCMKNLQFYNGHGLTPSPYGHAHFMKNEEIYGRTLTARIEVAHRWHAHYENSNVANATITWKPFHLIICVIVVYFHFSSLKEQVRCLHQGGMHRPSFFSWSGYLECSIR